MSYAQQLQTEILELVNCISDIPITSLTDNAAFEPLLALLFSERVESDRITYDIYRLKIAENLIMFGELSIQPLIHFLQDDSLTHNLYRTESLRKSIIELLGNSGSDIAISNLQTMLKTEKDWNILYAIMVTLTKTNKEEIIVEFIKSLLTESDELRRYELARALGESNHPECVIALILALKDVSPDVASAAAISLGKIKSPDALPYLMEAVNDFRTEQYTTFEWLAVASRAVHAIASYDTNETKNFAFLWYLENIKHEITEIREDAIYRLGFFNDNRAIPYLLELIADNTYIEKSDIISKIAQTSLKNINTPEALAALQQWKDQQNENN